jgi:hypothetical protein
MTIGDYFSELSERIGAAWGRFWFTPADPARCAVLRIAAGLLAIAHLASLGGDVDRWYAKDGLLTPDAVSNLFRLTEDDASFRYTYLGGFGSRDIRLVHWAAIAAAAAFTLGLVTPLSGALTAAALLAYVHRLPQVMGYLEPVLVFLVLYLTISPSGTRYSLDQLLFRRKAPPPAGGAGAAGVASWVGTAANIGLRLIQVHLAMFYVMMALTKLYGDAWWQGDAMWYLVAQTHSRPVDLSVLRSWGRSGALLINFWTHAVLYYELVFPILIWNRLARPLVLLLGVVIWLSLIVATGQLLFGLAMLVASAAFLPMPEPARAASR